MKTDAEPIIKGRVIRQEDIKKRSSPQLWLDPVAFRTSAGRLTSEQIKERIAQSKHNLANKDPKTWEHTPVDDSALHEPGSLLSGFTLDEIPARALLYGKGYDTPSQDKPAACAALESVK